MRWRSREHNDSAARLARIEAIADDVFGGHDEARAWLREPNGALGGESPLTDTEEGGRLVEAVLGRIAHGIVE
jgi:putative toxin-antitoxin system antitoxin component (TIGR02293 family)